MAFTVKFWGVRGTVPTPGNNTLRYGGQTSCVEMRCGEHLLVFDAGTGLFPLGEAVDTDRLDMFLSHTHIDHILGFPFFSPIYQEGIHVNVWAGHLLAEGRTIRAALSQLMSPPLFPLTLDFLKAKINYIDFEAGQTLEAEHLRDAGIRIQTLPLQHPDRATAYRVNYKNHSACYVTDVEHLQEGLDQALIEFIAGSDVFIYDSTFDDRDYPHYRGWGHSTWQEGVRLATAAKVKSLVLFHHDPGRSDDELDQRSAELQALRPNDYVAREGLTIRII